MVPARRSCGAKLFMDEDVHRSPHLSIGVMLHDFQLGGAERVAIRVAYRPHMNA
jgi:hypothetical protein